MRLIHTWRSAISSAWNSMLKMMISRIAISTLRLNSPFLPMVITASPCPIAAMRSAPAVSSCCWDTMRQKCCAAKELLMDQPSRRNMSRCASPFRRWNAPRASRVRIWCRASARNWAGRCRRWAPTISWFTIRLRVKMLLPTPLSMTYWHLSSVCWKFRHASWDGPCRRVIVAKAAIPASISTWQKSLMKEWWDTHSPNISSVITPIRPWTRHGPVTVSWSSTMIFRA